MTTEESVPISHEEFLRGYAEGRYGYRADISASLNLASRLARGWELVYIFVAQVLFTGFSTSIASIVLSFVLGDFWLLLGVPISWLGMYAGSAAQYPMTRGIAQVPFLLAVGGFLYGMFALGWRHPVFLLSSAFLLPHEAVSTVYAIGKRAFTRRVFESDEFYRSALEQDLLIIDERLG